MPESTLSFQQQWIWALGRDRPDWRCVVASAYRLLGPLDKDVLERCIAEVIRRNDALRSRVTGPGHAPFLQVDAPGLRHLTLVPMTGDSSAAREATARRWVQTLSECAVDPIVEPLLTTTLLELSRNEHWLVLGMHRLIGDCHSGDEVFREVWRLYNEFVRSPLEPVLKEEKHYSGYATWQSRTHPDWLSRHSAYWETRLEGAVPMSWRGTLTPAAKADSTLDRMNTWLGESLSNELRDFARRSHTLLANVMLAIYVAVLRRWSEQRDFIVPCFVAGRHAEHKAVIGNFSHVLYLRIELTGEETYSQLLAQVGNEFFRALAHQDFGRMAARKPELLTGTLFQWLTWQEPSRINGHLPQEAAEEPGQLTAERVTLVDFAEDLTALPPGMVAVEVTFFDTQRGIYVSGVYRSDMFSSNDMDRFMGDIRLTAQQFVRDPSSLLGPIPNTP